MRLVVLVSGQEHPRQCDGGVRSGRLELERSAQRCLVPLPDEPVRLGGKQRVEESIDGLRGLGAHELGRYPSVSERLHGRDPLDLEGPGEPWVGVDVDLHQLELAGACRGRSLEHGPKLPARATPLGPEVDDHGERLRAIDDR